MPRASRLNVPAPSTMFGAPHAIHGIPPDIPPLHVAATAGDVALRLRGVCGHLPREAFDVLVLRIAGFHLRWNTPVARRCRPRAMIAGHPMVGRG